MTLRYIQWSGNVPSDQEKVAVAFFETFIPAEPVEGIHSSRQVSVDLLALREGYSCDNRNFPLPGQR